MDKHPLNIRAALAHGRTQINPTDARLLLQYVLGVSHSYLLAHGDEVLTAGQRAHYQACLERAARHEPIPYITGRAPFYGRDFKVTPAVLIPRPETELLVDRALHWASQRPPMRIVDVGTGSGCIAVTLALELAARLEQPYPIPPLATDISHAALIVARQNARRHAATIHWVQSDLLTALGGPFDLVTANLPYISAAEWTHLDDGVKSYEPPLALRGGSEGLGLIRALLHQATTRLRSGGLLLLEIGWQQGPAVTHLAQRVFPNAEVALHSDYAGHDRIVTVAV